MITVRFPNGQAIRYNGANFIEWDDQGITLWDSNKKTQFIARVHGNAIVEYVQPCSVTNPLTSPAESIDHVLANLRTYSGDKLSKLKARLADFDRRTLSWKDR